jgi:hypothetical protein
VHSRIERKVAWWTVDRGLALRGLAVVGALGGLIAVGELASPEPEKVRGSDDEQPLFAAIAEIRAEEIASVLPRDAIPAIVRPELESAEDARLDDEEHVIGVELAGHARAYPVRVLSAHEIVNDEIAGKPYAVTW